MGENQERKHVLSLHCEVKTTATTNYLKLGNMDDLGGLRTCIYNCKTLEFLIYSATM